MTRVLGVKSILKLKFNRWGDGVTIQPLITGFYGDFKRAGEGASGLLKMYYRANRKAFHDFEEESHE